MPVKAEAMFADKRDYRLMAALLENWPDDPGNIRPAFEKLRNSLSRKNHVVFHFSCRPGISYSLRANIEKKSGTDGRLLALVDVVDDDPGNRWLSVCFYGDAIDDPNETGNRVPGGLFGEDGYCFDLYEYDDATIRYIEERMEEAYANTLATTY